MKEFIFFLSLLSPLSLVCLPSGVMTIWDGVLFLFFLFFSRVDF